MAVKCKILYWNQDDHVSGVVFLQQSNGAVKCIASAQGLPGTSLVSQLKEVNSELKHTQADAIIISGFVPEFICTEFFLPNLNRTKLKNSLLFELPRRFPILSDGMVCFFRPLQISGDIQRIKIRVWAVKRQIWSQIEDRLSEAGIKIDAFCHPFLAAELDQNCSIVGFPQIAPGLALSLGENGLAYLVRRDISEQIDMTGETLANYGFSRSFRQDKIFLSEIPDSIRLHRFTKSRNFAFILGVVAAVLCGTLIYRYWDDQVRHQENYRRALLRLDSEIREMNRRIEEVKPLGEFAQKMQEARDDTSVLTVLEMLTEKLPPNVWIHSFRMGNHRIALTLSVTGDATNLGDNLADLPGWNIQSQRQQRGTDGKEAWYITLQQNRYRGH